MSAARCLAVRRLGSQALLFESWRVSSSSPAHQPFLSPVGPPQAGSGNGRPGVWKLGPVACPASGRGASGLLRIALIRALSLRGWLCASLVQAEVHAGGPFMLPVTGTQHMAGPGGSRLSGEEALLLLLGLWLGPGEKKYTGL